MVFTHLPSAIFVAFIAIPSQMPLALTFLILRSCTQSMDVAPRSAFLAAIILPNERTAIMGILNVVKTFTSGLGPGLTGVLFDNNLAWIVFVAAGSLKVIYDLGMLAVFKGHESREDKRVRPADEET
jgi:sugar phosphate permease